MSLCGITQWNKCDGISFIPAERMRNELFIVAQAYAERKVLEKGNPSAPIRS